jgi:dihydropyrimidinase
MADAELVVKGGNVFTSEGSLTADIAIRGGVISEIGPQLVGARTVHATGLLVLPGGVDMHVHLSPSSPDPPHWVDDFESGSRAAAVGGVTTFGNISFPYAGEDLVTAMHRHDSLAAKTSIVDYLLHPVLMDSSPQYLAALDELVADGYSSVKIFMILEAFDRDNLGFVQAMEKAKALGLTVMIHCEDGCLVSFLAAKAVREGRGSLANYAASRPVYTEVVAVERAIGFCRATGARTYIVHLSSAEALNAARRARAESLPVHVETRPLYLHLTEEVFNGPEGPLYIGMPPVRRAADRDALWEGLRAKDIECCCTDHAPWSRAQKLDNAHDVTNVLAGVPELQTYLPMLYSEGVGGGRIDLQTFVDVVSTNPAKLFGLYPRKGTIAVGSDADIVVWDPSLTRTITVSDSVGNADYSPWEGQSVTGWPVVTIRRGEIVAERGRVVASSGSGRRVIANIGVAQNS